MLIFHYHHKFEDKMNLFTIKREFMEFSITKVTWNHKDKRWCREFPANVILYDDHSNEESYGLNLKIYSVTCTDTIRTQNDVNIYMPIWYRISRFLQNIPPILQMENSLIQWDKAIHFPELWEARQKQPMLCQRNSTLRRQRTSTEMDIGVDLVTTFTAWLEQSPKGLAVPKNVCNSVSLSLWDMMKSF